MTLKAQHRNNPCAAGTSSRFCIRNTGTLLRFEKVQETPVPQYLLRCCGSKRLNRLQEGDKA
jgi:hypothetical protein